MAGTALDVDFYDSNTYGPTLRMAGTSGGMKILRDVCQALAGGEPSVRLSELDGVRISRQIDSVEFRLGGDDGLCGHVGNPPAFIFDGDTSQWEERVLLLDPLVDPGKPGTFQFLEPDVVEGITVVAAVTS